MRRSPARRPLAALACACSLLLLLPGCADVRVQSLAPSGAATPRTEFEELTPEQRTALSEVLEGQILTVYPSDTGLIRAYGQVANLGADTYEAVLFQVVSDIEVQADDERMGAAPVAGQVTEVVGEFVIADMAPGDLDSFDVQTTVAAGETEGLRVQVGGVR